MEGDTFFSFFFKNPVLLCCFLLLFCSYSPAEGFITHFHFQWSHASHSTQGSCLVQPLSSSTDPELLHWERPRLSSLLRGSSLVVTVGAESMSCSFPCQRTRQVIWGWNGHMKSAAYKFPQAHLWSILIVSRPIFGPWPRLWKMNRSRLAFCQSCVHSLLKTYHKS